MAVLTAPQPVQPTVALAPLRDAPLLTAIPWAGAVKIALGFWLLAWVVKIHFFLPYFAWVCREYPLRFDFFPAAAADPWVSLLAYLAPLAVGTAAMISANQRVWQLAAVCLTAGAAALAVHLNAYNDATFVTSFWAGLWLLWLTTRDPSRPEVVAAHGPRLAQAVISLMFLGGAIGKLTPDYWDGTALYHIYLVQKQNFIYPWLRANCDEASLRGLAMVFSWTVILAELAVATLVLCASRKTLLISAVVIFGVAVVSTSFLFSVLGSLLGLAFAGARLQQKRATV